MREVRIDIAEDEERFFGHALITFHDASIAAGPMSIYLARKSTDTPHLGSDGWQANPAALDVELVSQSDGKTVVRAGPGICDKIPYSLYVRIEKKGSDVFGHAFWPEIMPSPKDYSGVLGNDKPEPVIVQAVAEPEPEPVKPAPPVFEPPPAPPVAPVPSPPKPQKKKLGWLAYLLIFLVLAAAATGPAYWKWDRTEPAPVQEANEEALSAKFTRLKQTDTDGSQLLALSDEAYAANDAAIGRQAIDEAVQRGNEAAKLRRAQWYDPRTFQPDRVEAIDSNAAARAYFELALGGNTEATALLKSMCLAAKAGGSHYTNFLDSTYCQGTLAP